MIRLHTSPEAHCRTYAVSGKEAPHEGRTLAGVAEKWIPGAVGLSQADEPFRALSGPEGLQQAPAIERAQTACTRSVASCTRDQVLAGLKTGMTHDFVQDACQTWSAVSCWLADVLGV